VVDVVRECSASAVYRNADPSPFARRRDDTVHARLDVPTHVFDGGTVHAPGSVLTKRGLLSQVFTPFYNTWRRTALEAWPEPGPAQVVALAGQTLPRATAVPRQLGGEAAAWQRLTEWSERVDDYPRTRDLPAIDGTSELSADLKFGTLAARTVMNVLGDRTPGRAAFVRQLAWRDWWAHLLATRPDAPDEFERWCSGTTGFPIVDAGMRQLTESGWMHNRVRMICASFLVKDLLIDWRRGERFFRHHLVDADVAQNAGNWQWVAGTGPDAAPYFRIFNPTSQGRTFDPEGEYVRRWVPELAGLPAKHIHDPSSAPTDVLTEAGVEVGVHYPRPIVEHATARTRAMAAYRQALSTT
jgi:deoxyribodipyrimidine photo-lyase